MMSGLYTALSPKESMNWTDSCKNKTKDFNPHFSSNPVKKVHRLWMPSEAAERGTKAHLPTACGGGLEFHLVCLGPLPSICWWFTEPA